MRITSGYENFLVIFFQEFNSLVVCLSVPVVTAILFVSRLKLLAFFSLTEFGFKLPQQSL